MFLFFNQIYHSNAKVCHVDVTKTRKNMFLFGFSLNFSYNFGFAEVTSSRKNSNLFGFSLNFS